MRIMDLGVWDLILGVDWMTHYSPITFNFHKLHTVILSEAEDLILQGCVAEAELNLLRNKELRDYINYKHSCYNISPEPQGGGPDTETPAEVKELLDRYKDVFATPTVLPLREVWIIPYLLSQMLKLSKSSLTGTLILKNLK